MKFFEIVLELISSNGSRENIYSHVLKISLISESEFIYGNCMAA